jgi:hypothetical protein
MTRPDRFEPRTQITLACAISHDVSQFFERRRHSYAFRNQTFAQAFERATCTLRLRITRVPVGRRASCFVLVAQCLLKRGPGRVGTPPGGPHPRSHSSRAPPGGRVLVGSG